MKFLSIQALRGIAASMVVILHMTSFAARGGNYYAVQIYEFLQHFMSFGVDIFFVISGVIISGILRSERGGKAPLAAAAGFLFRRAVRIYPVFWLSLLAASLVLKFGKVTWPNAFRPRQYTFDTLALVTTHPMLPVSWTLVFELQFYLVTGIALLFGRHAIKIMALWAVVHIGLTAATWFGWSPGLYFALPVTIEFILGLIVGFAVGRYRIPPVLGFVAALVAFGCQYYFGADAIAANIGWLHFFVNGPTAAVIVWAAMSWEYGGGKAPRSLSFTGDISYSIYLWHWPAMLLLLVVFGETTNRTWVYGVFLVVAAIATGLVGYLSYRFIELPTNRWASRVSRPKRVASSTPPAVAS